MDIIQQNRIGRKLEELDRLQREAHADTHPIYHRGDSAQHRPGGALGRLLDQTIEREEFHRDQLLRARRIRMALEGLVERRER